MTPDGNRDYLRYPYPEPQPRWPVARSVTVTSRARDLCIGFALCFSVLGMGSSVVANVQGYLDREDRRKTKELNARLLKTLDPEHAAEYDRILNGK